MPTNLVPSLEWDIRREKSVAWWGPGNPACKHTNGPSDWAGDDNGNVDESLVPTQSLMNLFVIDGPGYGDLPPEADYKYAEKSKFRDWVQVKIAGKWYVCSPYKHWRVVTHAKYDAANGRWVLDNEKVNEVVEGTLEGFSDSWSDD
jgi:hypothetical protein